MLKETISQNKRASCYICNGSEIEEVQGKVRDKEELRILMCKDCGLIFLNNFDHIDNLYYEESKMRSGNKQKFAEYIKETYLDDARRANWISRLVEDKTVLDFGCGNGRFLFLIRALATSIMGIEQDKQLAKIITEVFKFKVLSGIYKIEERYDIITSFHVLEHLKDPRKVLKELHTKLEDNGTLIIEVPNSRDALLSLYNCKAYSEFIYWSCHLRIFNQYTLRRLLESAGFEINYIKQIQRYPFSNHLRWLIEGQPDGHKLMSYMDNVELNTAYETKLMELGACDTLIASARKKNAA